MKNDGQKCDYFQHFHRRNGSRLYLHRIIHYFAVHIMRYHFIE